MSVLSPTTTCSRSGAERVEALPHHERIELADVIRIDADAPTDQSRGHSATELGSAQLDDQLQERRRVFPGLIGYRAGAGQEEQWRRSRRLLLHRRISDRD